MKNLYQFKTCNLIYLGCKYDECGNKKVILSYQGGRRFSIHSINLNGGSLFYCNNEMKQEFEKVIIDYIVMCGTEKQKSNLKMY